MKLFIPACGDRLILTAPWTFHLYLERRNMEFAKRRGLVEPTADGYGVWEDGNRWSGSAYKRVDSTLEAGSIIECDRVYIRCFSKSAIRVEKDYDSISWRLIKKNKPVPHHRFWTKLPDVYKIEYELTPDSLYRDRIKLVREVLES